MRGSRDYIKNYTCYKKPEVYKNTLKFVKNQLKNGKKDLPFGIILKKDLAREYRKNKEKDYISLDIKSLPSRVMGLYYEIQVNIINDRTKKIVYKNYKTTALVVLKGSRISTKGIPELELEKLKERGYERFGYNPDYVFDKSIYTGNKEKMTFRCPKCGKYYQTTPNSHFSSFYGLCKKCGNTSYEHPIRKCSVEEYRRIIKELFLDELEPVFLPDKKYVADARIDIIDKKTGIVYNRRLDYLVTGCDPRPGTSQGETIITSWLQNNKINFQREFYLNLDYCSRRIFIDFRVEYKGKVIFIEYNGKQHYTYVHNFFRTKERYFSQLDRDQVVRDYCKSNSIILLEIPYKYNTINSIYEVLNNIIINGLSINTIVLPKINRRVDHE